MKGQTVRTRIIGVVGMTAAALLLTSCAVQTSPGGGSSSAAAKQLASVPGFSLNDGIIHVGQMTALSGPLAPSSNEQVAGQQAYWDYVNSQGGIGGKYKVQVITADNQYNPQLAVQEYQRIKGDVVMLSGVLGDASTEALIPLLQQNKAVALPSTQSSRFTQNPNLGMTFTSYQSNVWNALAYLFDQKKITQKSTVCSMVQADQSGAARQAALEYAAKQLGFVLGLRPSSPPPTRRSRPRCRRSRPPSATPSCSAARPTTCRTSWRLRRSSTTPPSGRPSSSRSPSRSRTPTSRATSRRTSS